jgi:signal transduction histidine kinase
MSAPFTGRRFWLWYALAWLDLAAVYCVVFRIAGQDSFPKAAVGALVYVLPMALAGTAAIPVFRRLEWHSDRRLGFVAAHAGMALAFGFGVTASNHLLFSLLHSIAPSVFRPVQFNLAYATWETLMGILIYGVLAGVCYAILLHRRMREQEALAAQAELRALRAQLNPHFLFNTLHSLLALVRHDPRAAEDSLVQFGDLLRYTLDTQKNGEVVPLGEELDFVDAYLALEALRLGERLRLAVEIDPTVRDRHVPAFCLQPLVENAIRHAIAPRTSGGRLAVRARREGGTLVLEVEDDGPGVRAVDLDGAAGLGLRLVRERLAAHYGGAATLGVDTEPGRGFRATIRIPAAGARA